MTDTESLRAAELRFQKAQATSDVAELDALLHPDLSYVGPDGQVGYKAADLEAHASRDFQIASMATEELLVRVTDGVGITTLIARVTGRFHDSPFDTRMVYTRCWAIGLDGWRVVAAHLTPLALGE